MNLSMVICVKNGSGLENIVIMHGGLAIEKNAENFAKRRVINARNFYRFHHFHTLPTLTTNHELNNGYRDLA